MEKTIKGFLLGAVVGAVAGVLLAPKSGAETREDLKKLAGEVGEKAEDMYLKAKKVVVKKVALLKEAGEKIDEKKYGNIVNGVLTELKDDGMATGEAVSKLGRQLKRDWKMVSETVSEKKVATK